MKSGLVETADDDRALIMGVLVEAVARLRSEDREQVRMLWRRRGGRAFSDEGP